MISIGVRTFIGVFLASMCFTLYSCGSNNAEKKAEEEKSQARRNLASGLANKHGAVVDWRESLPDDFEKVYTADYQKVFLREDGRPLVFLGSVDDVMRTDSGWVLVVNVGSAREDIGYELFFLLDSPLYCRMSVQEELASQILSESRDLFGAESIRLFVVDIKAIKRPRFTIDTESYAPEEGPIETEILVVPSDILYLYGKCLEAIQIE